MLITIDIVYYDSYVPEMSMGIKLNRQLQFWIEITNITKLTPGWLGQGWRLLAKGSSYLKVVSMWTHIIGKPIIVCNIYVHFKASVKA